MKVSEAIEKLTNKRNDALSFMSDIYKKGDAGYLANEIRVTTYNIAINTLQQIDDPQAEKQEVSQEFADWVENAMVYQVMTKEWCLKEIANMGWEDWLHDPQNGEKYPCDNHWSCEVYGDKEKHIKAIYDGYTVKPKRWVVKEGDLVIRKGKHEAKIYFVEGADEDGILLVNGIQDEYYSDEDCNLDSFYEEFRLLAKKENLEPEVDGSVEEV